ncbi:MAG: hypothetical protein HQ567_10325 [Candidatus Nealsonbacteria bacterium]|nr:hypothetical protein [Candidatus Nealsonbacteria bacterium]
MAQIEQAIFTSAKTDRAFGYHLAAKSPGVVQADARKLTIWGPSHDSLLELEPDAVSVNFHPLPSGAYCVSQTTASGFEYSGRGGRRVYTQCLIVPPDVFARFGNNAFAIIRAADAAGILQTYDLVPRQLDSLRLAGRATPVDQNLIARLAANPGPAPVAALIGAAIEATCLAVTGPLSAADLIAGLINLLPPECRSEFSFSTGLKFSTRRQFRILALSADRAEQRWIGHQHDVTVLDLSNGRPAAAPVDGWARFVDRVLASGRTSFLATQLSKRRFDLTPADLPALGLQLLEEFDATALGDESRKRPTIAHIDAGADAGADVPAASDAASTDESDALSRADAAHRKFDKTTVTARAPRSDLAPSKTLHPDSPEVLEKLEHLDDVVYEAISGQETSLQELQTLWPEVLAELGESLVDESREQYLRYAMSIWEDTIRDNGIRNPARAMQTLDVLCLLFDEVEK